MDLKGGTLEAFRDLLDDPSEPVRIRTAQQLRWLGDGAAPLLRRAVRDPDRRVRLCAIRALGKIGTPPAVEVLAGDFAPDDGEHLFPVLRALGFSTAPVDRAVAHIETGLRSEVPEALGWLLPDSLPVFGSMLPCWSASNTLKDGSGRPAVSPPWIG